MKLWTLIFAGIAAVAAVTTAILMFKQFRENSRLEQMKERLYLSLKKGRINIAELIQAGEIQEKEASLALKACYALARDGVGEFWGTDFYIKGRVPAAPKQ